jgi:hypothetical protein
LVWMDDNGYIKKNTFDTNLIIKLCSVKHWGKTERPNH